MELRVLGPVEVVEDGRSFPLGGPKQRTVLALLIANAGRSVSTGSLINGVYGEEPPQGARRSIQTYVSNLRSELGDIIVGTNDGYELAVERSAVDAMRFEDAISAAKDRSPAEASEILREALGLWHGHPYADVDGGHDLDAEIRRLDEMRMQALEAHIDADLAAGFHRELIAEIESLTVEYPLRERFTEQQMVALYRSGRQAEALRAYERTRTYLINEMGLDPSPDLRDLERRILDQDADLDLEAASSIRRATVMVTDIADPSSLSSISTDERTVLIDELSAAIDAAADSHDGEIFANSGTAVYLLFPDAFAAASAASDIQRQLDGTEPEGHRLRIAIDVGDIETGDTVTGPPVNRSAAIVSAAHGGQVLLSSAAQQEITETAGGGWVVRGLGSQDLRGLDSPEIVHQLVIDGLLDRFPDLRTQAVPASLPMAARGLAGYELREEVGSGAFGVVHRAYQPSVGREVAVKVIRPEWANQPEFVRRFEIEAQLVARLEHPHIVPLYDYWREPDSAYLVMRWLRGGTLGNRIASSRMSIDEVHSLLADIGPALAFAHRQGVVHRDIKPSNVLLDDEGTAYLSDFGIAGDTAQRGGSVAEDVRELAGLLHFCIGASSEPAVTDLLARATSEDDSFADVRSFIAAWEEAVGAGDATSRVVGYTPTRNPYKGLSAFGELDAADFHGRDDVVAQLLAALEENDLVVTVGPSGIGKSSVVKAGLIPALRDGGIDGSDQWLITTMVPGAFPFDELGAALLRVAVKAPSDLEDVLRKDARGLGRVVARYLPPDETVVLVVDQFEELFTLCEDEDLRTGFLDTLVAATQDPRSRIKIVLTIRADFFDRPLAYGDFGALVQEATVPITSPTETQLDEIVRAPANGVGVGFELGLPERFVAAVKDQPGGLPLLEFSLTELFESRDSDVITTEAYEASGGVKAALGRRAETTYNGLDVSQQNVCSDIFLRMVTVNESGRDTRRRVRLSEIKRLGYDPRSVDDILSAFSAHRLVTFDRDPLTRGPTVEVAHEAILTEWPRLAAWIDEHREDLLLRSRLAAAVADWETADRSDTYLLTSGRLNQHETWTADSELTLTSAEQEFLTASRLVEDERRAKRRRTRRLVMSGFGIAAAIALALAAAALVARNDTAEQAALAKENQQTAETNQALAEANASDAKKNASVANQKSEEALRAAATAQLRQASIQSETDPELATLLALTTAQNGYVDDEQLARILHLVLQNWKLVARHDPGFFGLLASIAPDRTGRYLSGITEDGEIILWDYANQRQPVAVGSWTTHPAMDPANPPRFVPNENGTEIASVGDDGILRVWNTGTDDPVAEIPLIDGPQGIPNSGWVAEKWITFEPGGDRAAVVTWTDVGGRTADLHIVDLRKGVVLDSTAIWEPFWIEWRPDGQLAVLIRFNEGGMYLFDPLDLPEVDGDGMPVDPEANIIVATELHAQEGAISKDGQTVAIGALQGFMIADAATGEVRIGPLDLGGPVGSVEFSPDDRLIAVAVNTGAITVLEVATGNHVAEFDGESLYLTWAIDGSTLGTIDLDGGGDVWDASGKPSGELWSRDLGDVLVTRFAASRDEIAVMTRENPSRPGSLFVIDSLTGDVLREHPDRWGYGVMFTPDGSEILSQPGSIDEADKYSLGPFEALDEGGGVSTTFDASCPDYYEEDCAEDPDWFWLFSVSAAMSPNGDVFASGYQAMATWEVDTGRHLATSAEEVGFLIVIGFTTQEELVATIEQPDDTFDLTWFDPYTLNPLKSMRVSEFYAISPDGSILISWANDQFGETSDDPGVQVHTLRDGDSGGIIGSIETNSGGQPFFTPSGARFGIYDHEREITIWDTETLTITQTIPLATQYSDAIWLDESTIAMLYDGGAIVALTTDTQDLISAARSRLTRTLTSVECREFDIDLCPTLEELKSG